MKKTHKATNFEDHAKDIKVRLKAECKIENKTLSFWVSHHWEDVDCEKCLLKAPNFEAMKSIGCQV